MNRPIETEQDLKALFDRGAGMEVPGDVEERMRERLEWLRQQVGASGVKGAAPWRIPWFQGRSRSLAVAAASLVVAAGLMALWLLVAGGSSPAFAKVLDQIRVFQSYACTQTIYHKGYPDFTNRIQRKSLSQRRETWPDGSIHVFDLTASPVRILTLIPAQQRAMEEELTGVGPAKDPDLLQILVNAQPDGAESLGTNTIDGKAALGFHIPDPVNDWTVWVDPKTLLPIRIELVQPRIERRIVMSDFDFDVEFDDALFATTAPEGYAVETVTKDGTTPTGDDLVKGLRALATLLDGEFPPSLEWPEVQKALREHFRQKGEEPSEEQVQLVREYYPRAQRYLSYLKAFERVRNLEYVGGGAELGDATAPILWWQPRDSDTWRVLFGDLTFRDVDPEDLPGLVQDTE